MKDSASPAFASTTAIEDAAALFRKTERAVVLTGAGISTPSGIPDFRSEGSGLWSHDEPMEVASLNTFRILRSVSSIGSVRWQTRSSMLSPMLLISPWLNLKGRPYPEHHHAKYRCPAPKSGIETRGGNPRQPAYSYPVPIVSGNMRQNPFCSRLWRGKICLCVQIAMESSNQM